MLFRDALYCVVEVEENERELLTDLAEVADERGATLESEPR